MEEFNVMKHWYDKADDSPSKKPVKKEPNWTFAELGATFLLLDALAVSK